MDENAPDTLDSQPRDEGPASEPSHDASAPIKTAAEYAGAFKPSMLLRKCCASRPCLPGPSAWQPVPCPR